MKYSLHVLSCLLLVLLAPNVHGSKRNHCLGVRCPAPSFVRRQCRHDRSKVILYAELTKLCCTYCVKMLTINDKCQPFSTVKEPVKAICMVKCDPKTHKCIQPKGSIVKVKSKVLGAGQAKSTVLASTLLGFILLLGVTNIFYLIG